jgi:hypothetical protein
VGDRPLALLEDAGSLPRAPLPRRDVRSAWQRTLRSPARAGLLYREGVRGRRPHRPRRDQHRPRCGRHAFPRRPAVAAPRSRACGPGRRARFHRPLCSAGARPSRPDDPFVRRFTRHRRGLGEVQPPLLAARVRELPLVLLLADLHGAALDETHRGRGRLGTGHGRLDLDRGLDGPLPRREGTPRPLRTNSVSGARDSRRSGRDQPAHAGRRAGRGSRGPPRDHAGKRAFPPTCATRSRSTCSCATSSSRRSPRQAGRAASRDASARSTSLRPSASAMRNATLRSRTSCASSIPISRSTGSRNTP